MGTNVNRANFSSNFSPTTAATAHARRQACPNLEVRANTPKRRRRGKAATASGWVSRRLLLLLESAVELPASTRIRRLTDFDDPVRGDDGLDLLPVNQV